MEDIIEVELTKDIVQLYKTRHLGVEVYSVVDVKSGKELTTRLSEMAARMYITSKYHNKGIDGNAVQMVTLKK